MKKIAITIPFHKQTLNEYEEKSLECLLKKADKENIFLILPEKLKENFNYQNIKKIYFDDKYFKSQKTYNKLLLSIEFFLRFDSYNYILIYQLDSFLIKEIDELKSFYGEDYIGSPHFNVKKKRFNGILNGGFSMRAVRPSTEVLRSEKINITFDVSISVLRYFAGLNRLKSFIKFIFHIITIYISDRLFRKKNITISKVIINEFPNHYNEDIFWSLFSKLFFPNFKVANHQIAMKFGFDKDPELLLNENKNQLPVGCHNWWSNVNINFWSKYF